MVMIQSVCIHGRQAGVSRAELESLYGSAALQPLGPHTTGLTLAPEQITFKRLGGTIKLGKVLTILETTQWTEIEKYLAETIPAHLQYVPDGKFRLGLSVYGLSVSVTKLNTSGLTLKKVIKAAGRSVRIVPNKEPELNSAQVLHNQLTGPTGWELLLIKDGNQTVLAQTVAIQDIEAYAARDQARPKRDARVGMLPPKLAQTILNLATGNRTEQLTVLDPFCGTGVVLQEAWLMGYCPYGTDLEARMIEYSQTNLAWLAQGHATPVKLEVADATDHTWSSFDAIAAETYLGRPFSALPAPDVLNEVMRDVDTIHRKFLQNVARQTKPGFRMCIAVPAWKSRSGFQHLKTLDSLEELGYTRVSFQSVSNQELIYHRENQVVGRELVVLIRK